MKKPLSPDDPKSRSLSRADVLLHPVRLRIALVLQGRRLTPQQIGALLTDVPPATLYRQINRLAEAGIITVVEQRSVHGTQERVYTVVEETVQLTPADFTESRPEDFQRYFNAFIATLVHSFDRFIAHETGTGRRDGLMFYEDMVYLTDTEYAAVANSLRETIHQLTQNTEGDGRRRRLLAAIAITEPQVADSVSGDSEPVVENRELPESVDRPVNYASDAGI